jgi:6-phosphogluconolactonase (cycloisomerase 2 family)
MVERLHLSDVPTSLPRLTDRRVDPPGSYVLAENMSGTIVVFRVDPETGALDTTGQILEVSQPSCVKFVPIPE